MNIFVPEGSSHTLGRSREKAAALLEVAAELGLEGQVATTTDGYIVSDEVLKGYEEAIENAQADAQADVKAQADAVADADAEKRKAEDAALSAKAEEVAKQAEIPEAPFDPSTHNVAEVQAYLEGADQAERDRVYAAELTGKARTSLVANTEGAK